MIDSLLAQFGAALCRKLSDGLIYFEFLNELAFFWCDKYQWQQVDPLDFDAIMKYRMFPSVFIDKFISLLNETLRTNSKNIKMFSMAFNSRLNTNYKFLGGIDMQLMQIDLEHYICVYAELELCEQRVTLKWK